MFEVRTQLCAYVIRRTAWRHAPSEAAHERPAPYNDRRTRDAGTRQNVAREGVA